jgi:hypothetical protein
MTNVTISPATIFGRADGVIAVDMGGETVMMDVEQGVYFAIAGSGNEIWNALEEPATLTQILAVLDREYDLAGVEDLEGQVREFLTDMLGRKLVTATG